MDWSANGFLKGEQHQELWRNMKVVFSTGTQHWSLSLRYYVWLQKENLMKRGSTGWSCLPKTEKPLFHILFSTRKQQDHFNMCVAIACLDGIFHILLPMLWRRNFQWILFYFSSVSIMKVVFWNDHCFLLSPYFF